MKLINFQAPEDFIVNLKELAKRQTVSVSVVIRLAVLEYMEKHKLPEPKRQSEQPKEKPIKIKLTPKEKKYNDFIDVIKDDVGLIEDQLEDFEAYLKDRDIKIKFCNGEPEYVLMGLIKKDWGGIIGIDFINAWKKHKN